MPINAYTGLMGSGKSYECVSSVIVPAVKAGRRVVTNVDGIDGDAIRAYCQDKFSVPLERLGQVVHCTNEDVAKDNFLPHGGPGETLCQPGDIVCIDEAWRFWGTDCKLLPEHKVFFREHRHFVDPTTKVCCDLVLMVQDISDLHRILKVVVEVSFRTTKIKTLGWSKTYRVEMWEGHKLTTRGRVSVENKRYNAEIFPLYSSYTGGSGKELQVDDRQNILKSPKLWILAGGTILMFGVSLYSLVGFFDGSRFKKDQSGVASKTDSAHSGSKTVSALEPGKINSAHPGMSGFSETWRAIGSIQSGANTLIVLSGPSGRIRFEHPSVFQNVGALIVGEVDGQRVTVWTGESASSLSPAAAK